MFWTIAFLLPQAHHFKQGSLGKLFLSQHLPVRCTMLLQNNCISIAVTPLHHTYTTRYVHYTLHQNFCKRNKLFPLEKISLLGRETCERFLLQVSIQLNCKRTGAGWQNPCLYYGNVSMAPRNLPCPKRRSAFRKLPEAKQLGKAVYILVFPLAVF